MNFKRFPVRRTRLGNNNPEWRTACAVDVLPVPAAGGTAPDNLGKIIAERHPTGWFIRAEYCREFSRHQLATFRDFVAVRVYLLLTGGPQPGAWSAGYQPGIWLATWRTDSRELSARIPDFVPENWR